MLTALSTSTCVIPMKRRVMTETFAETKTEVKTSTSSSSMSVVQYGEEEPKSSTAASSSMSSSRSTSSASSAAVSSLAVADEKESLADLFAKAERMATMLPDEEGRYPGRTAVMEALEIYESLACQTEDRIMQAWAWLWLGASYEGGYRTGGLDGYARGSSWRGFDCLRKAAEQTACAEVQAEACVHLGYMYRDGKVGFNIFGRAVDNKKAISYFTKAAEQKASAKVQAEAWVALGDMYKDGHGVTSDYLIARDYYIKAVEQEVSVKARAEACLTLGRMYKNGYGVAKDPRTARWYFRRAAQQRVSTWVREDALEALGLNPFKKKVD